MFWSSCSLLLVRPGFLPPHLVRTVTSGGNSGQLVSLSGCTDLGGAEELAGSIVLARVEDLPHDYLLSDRDALVGRTVVDEEHGELGSISEVLTGAANDVWVVEGPYGEVLVPVVDEFVVSCEQTGPLRVRVPQGTVPAGGA